MTKTCFTLILQIKGVKAQSKQGYLHVSSEVASPKVPKHFADDPAAWFEYESTRAHQLPRAEAEALQLETLRARFSDLRSQLPPLAALASAQGITDIASLDSAAPLLFPHAVFKSYPEQLLVSGAYAFLTEWVQRLTTADLSAVRGRNFATMDDWLDALDSTAIDMYHSSGTTGRLSFYPRGKAEILAQLEHGKMTIAEWFDPPTYRYGDYPLTLIWPAHGFGRSAILRAGQMFRALLTEDGTDFHPLLPTALSADYQYHVLRTANLHAQGHKFGPVASQYVRARLEEADALKAFVPERTEQLLDIMADRKRDGRRVMIAGGPVNIHTLAKAGLDKGVEGALVEGSLIRAFGGLKNHADIPTLEADITRFSGAPNYLNAFGMTELTSSFSMCRAGRFHIPPWIIPYVLDEDDGRMKPRSDTQQGRAAFVDLLPQSYWGGVATADRVDVSWQPCACGRTSVHMSPNISRIAEPPGGDFATTPATDAAVRAAFDALNEGLLA